MSDKAGLQRARLVSAARAGEPGAAEAANAAGAERAGHPVVAERSGGVALPFTFFLLGSVIGGGLAAWLR